MPKNTRASHSLPDFSLENAAPLKPVCGVDEAGRGPWAGPVVAASVMFFEYEFKPALSDVNDSKKLKPARREALYDVIGEHAHIGIGIAEVEEIDTLNIWGATQLAMRRAVLALPERFSV